MSARMKVVVIIGVSTVAVMDAAAVMEAAVRKTLTRANFHGV